MLIHCMAGDGNAQPAAPCTVVHMGFNPFREEQHSRLDVGLVIVAVLITLGLVAWGFFGGG